jgi:hypothetical protein
LSPAYVELISAPSRPAGMARSRLSLGTLILVWLLAACSAAGGSPGGSQGPITEADAIRLALAQDARFAGIGPAEADAVGQAAWYEVAVADDGWQITIRIGWGDCPAGCINQHAWIYRITNAGEVSLVRDQGDVMPDTGVRGVVVAGPTCPVETIPPQSGCEGRLVQGAVLIFTDSAGVEAARATSAADGTFDLALAPGVYRVVPQPVEGLMGTAAESTFSVELGQPKPELTIAYDTGIR